MRSFCAPLIRGKAKLSLQVCPLFLVPSGIRPAVSLGPCPCNATPLPKCLRIHFLGAENSAGSYFKDRSPKIGSRNYHPLAPRPPPPESRVGTSAAIAPCQPCYYLSSYEAHLFSLLYLSVTLCFVASPSYFPFRLQSLL